MKAAFVSTVIRGAVHSQKRAVRIAPAPTLLRPNEIVGVKKEQRDEQNYSSQAVGAYDKYRDPKKWPSFLTRYIQLADMCNLAVQSTPHNNIIILCIILAGVLVGIQLYPSLEQAPLVKNLDLFVLLIFTSECAMKIISEGVGFWRYFVGTGWQWNVFDFVIVMATMPFTPLYTMTGNRFGALRLLRLLRLFKVFRKFPQLQTIVMGLIGGIKSVIAIVTLLFLVFYVYAIFGINAFRKNDPWHWSSLNVALVTLFRASTLEDWSDIMYYSVYGCNVYKTGGGLTYCDVSNEDCTGVDPMFHCTNPSTSYVIAPLFFISFVVVSAFVMMSLFIGAVTMAMAESMQSMKAEKDEKDRLRRLEKGKKRALQLWLAPSGNTATGSEVQEGPMQTTGKVLRKRAKLKKLLICAWEGSDVSQVGNDEELAYFTGWKRLYSKAASVMEELTEKPTFVNFITVTVVVAGALAGISTYEHFASGNSFVLSLADQIISLIFAVEVFCKVIACEFEPGLYFQNKGNCFDFVLVMAGYIPQVGSLLVILRLLRLLRVLKLVNKLPQLQIIVTALLMGLGSIGYIGVILLIFIYVYAVLGCSMFRLNDPWHFGTLHSSLLTLFRCSTLEDWSDVFYINFYGCSKFGYNSEMNASKWKCNVEDSGPVPFTTVYFVTFVILGALVLLTLFIGVVTTSMEEATLEMEKKSLVALAVEKTVCEHQISPHVVSLYRAVFDFLDLDGGGAIEIDELKIGLAAIGKKPSEEDLDKIILTVDESRKGELDFSHFLKLMVFLKNRNSSQLDRMNPLEEN